MRCEESLKEQSGFSSCGEIGVRIMAFLVDLARREVYSEPSAE